MSEYIKFTEEQIQQANDVDLEAFLIKKGEQLIKSGREKRLVSDHSVTIRGSRWYDHADQSGGRSIEFVKRLYRISFPEAVKILLGTESGEQYSVATEWETEVSKEFILPEANSNMSRVFAYLAYTRFISREVLSHFASTSQLYEDIPYHNAVFVGMDRDGVARHAHKRSTNSKGKTFRQNVEGSDPEFCFHHHGDSRLLHAFESPIDMLSYITLHPKNWQKHSYVSCCGTSSRPVRRMLMDNPKIDTLVLCLDNDDTGHRASRRMINEFTDYTVKRENPERKDWNDDLIAKHMMLKGVGE